MLRYELVELAVGQALQPGQRWSNVIQTPDRWIMLNAGGFEDDSGPGLFVRPAPLPPIDWIIDAERAEVAAHAEYARRAAMRNAPRMTNAEYRYEREFARAVQQENPEYRRRPPAWVRL